MVKKIEDASNNAPKEQEGGSEPKVPGHLIARREKKIKKQAKKAAAEIQKQANMKKQRDMRDKSRYEPKWKSRLQLAEQVCILRVPYLFDLYLI